MRRGSKREKAERREEEQQQALLAGSRAREDNVLAEQKMARGVAGIRATADKMVQ